MAYSDFTLDQLELRFGVRNQVAPLFEAVEAIVPSARLLDTLRLAAELPLRSEKAKSEGIVFPILVELRERNDKFFTIYSGENLSGAEAEGLRGECDFMLAKDVRSFSVNYPIFQLVEAKKHDLEGGVGQCAAQLLGAQLFNERRGVRLPFVYGCVTNGTEWLFMRLSDKVLLVDNRLYFFQELPLLLGAFQVILSQVRQVLDEAEASA